MLHGRFPILGGSSLNAAVALVGALLLGGHTPTAAAADLVRQAGTVESSPEKGGVSPVVGEVVRVVRDVGVRLRARGAAGAGGERTSRPGAAGASRRDPTAGAGRPGPTPEPCTRSVVVVSSDARRADQRFPVSRTADVACVLRQGDIGPEVRTLQRSLNTCYGSGLREDGVFGPRTRRAVGAVQRALGLPGSGTYGPGTRQAMYRDGGFAWQRWSGGQRLCGRAVDGGAGEGRTSWRPLPVVDAR